MRPKIIYHMVTSIDGKVTGDFLRMDAQNRYDSYYYEKHREMNTQGFMCGRVTMQTSFTGVDAPDLSQSAIYPKEDYIGLKKARYAIAIDKNGKLNWQEGVLHDEDPGYDGHGLIEILSEDIDERYLGFLRERQISYIFAGEKTIDLQVALEKLHDVFGIDTIMMEGGGATGGTFMKADLIDEISFVIAPYLEGNDGVHVFGNEKLSLPQHFHLVEMTPVGEGFYVRYERESYE